MYDYETITYKGYDIKISRTDWAENPMDDWDMLGDFIALSDHTHLNTGNLEDYDIYEHYGSFYHIPNSVGYEYVDLESRTPIDVDDLAEVITKRTKALVYEFVSRGYSQGDYLAGLMIVPYDKLVKEYGTTKDGKLHPTARTNALACLKGEVAVFSAWLWGDVFHYTIEDHDGELIDSCGGFYGTNFEDNGLLDDARTAIDAEVREDEAMEAEIQEMALIELGAA